LASLAGVSSNDGNGNNTTFDVNALEQLTQNINQMLSTLNKTASPSDTQDQSITPSNTTTDSSNTNTANNASTSSASS
jgi:hypothetical protein